VFRRPLALHLLAPTVLVSLALVAACISGALVLNNLQVNVSNVLTENVQSTRAATGLETALRELHDVLQGPHTDPGAVTDQLATLNQRAREWLEEAQRWANWQREKDLVAQITADMAEYFARFEQRKDAHLAASLEEPIRLCNELRQFNSDQVVDSDKKNQQIVRYLNWGLLAVGLGAPVSGLLLGYAVARSLRHSIYQLSVSIRDAAGRLNRELGSVRVEEEGDFPGLHRQMEEIGAEIERVVEQLQQRDREILRTEQLAAVGQVAAGVAHELRNPLTSVKMLVQAGKERQPAPGLPPEDLGIIEQEVRRMEQYIQTFLDFARPPRSERRQADLVAVLRRALALVEGRVRRQKVTLVADLPPEPVRLLIDPEQIHQVTVNLLLNALDALPRGGTIHLTLDKHLVSRNGSSGSAIKVSIRDSGPGISPRIQERLFQPFVSSKETGVGLGLSISKRLVEAHGGTICGENNLEGGALFAFTLPA
jgi:two-component system, NtrC family, sensor histidine kinase HydH